MKTKLTIFLAMITGVILISACSDDETYAEQKDKERKAINSFIKRDVTIVSDEGDTLCHVGKIHPITEQQFQEQGCTTDLKENQYVLFKSSGVYMQIVRPGVGEPLKDGESKRVLCQFFEFNILGDSLKLRSEVPFWATNPEILDVANTSGTISGTFSTDYNMGGPMYMTYYASSSSKPSVPKGWLVPLSYIRLGRQTTSDEGIAMVRLIVPHSEGQTEATTNVYPCFYEIKYQEVRD